MCLAADLGKVGTIFYVYLLKDFPPTLQMPCPLAFCYKTWISSKEIEWIKSQRWWENKLSCTQIWSKQLPGAHPEGPGTGYTRTLPVSTDMNTKPTSVQEEAIHVVPGWSLTCLCWLWDSFSVIIKSSLKRGFSSTVETWLVFVAYTRFWTSALSLTFVKT